MDTKMNSFDDARAAVAGGVSPLDAARMLIAQMTPDERLWCLDGDAPTYAGGEFLTTGYGYHRAPFRAAEVERLGLPGIAFSDGPRGSVIGNATCFPVPMARGATWDPELEERVGEAIGSELRAIGATITGAVCVNLLRHPAWGRAQETYGEDPHHVGELGAAFTRGLQQHVMACAKHFACNSMENARFAVNIDVDEVALHEIYLAQFRRIVEEGVASIMSAYNSVNGEWCGQNHQLLTQILRDEWGFEGFVISDWVFGVHDAAGSLQGGLDIEMPFRMVRQQHLSSAIEQGDVDWSQVDQAVERIIATLLRFDNVLSRPAPADTTLGNPEHRQLAREVASRSVVLLRNQPVEGAPVLPLSVGSTGRLAVLGVLADEVNLGDHGSSDVWDLDCHTVLEGLREVVSDVIYHEGRDIASAAATASDADTVIVVVGYTSDDEGEYMGKLPAFASELFPPSDEPEVAERYEELISHVPVVSKPYGIEGLIGGFSTGGDRLSLRLPTKDIELIRAVAAVNPRTVVVIQAGSAVLISEWLESVPAVVQSWYAGSQAGPGLADVLFGAVNPSGRLPFSVPINETDLPDFDRDATNFMYDRWHGWWHLAREGIEPLFPFGFGLSYATFEIDAVTVEVGPDGIDVSGSVINLSEVGGADVVQIYARLPDPELPSRLAAFVRVEVAAGARAPFRTLIAFDRLATWNPTEKSWIWLAGQHVLTVSRSARDRFGARFEIDVSTISTRNERPSATWVLSDQRSLRD